jgi:AcrR family transcriptional regulator
MKDSNSPVNGDLSARERILHTAHDLFYRDGIRATGIDRVIAEAGVAKATFYHHFPSKNDLICEFLEYRHRRWMDWFADALARHGGTIEALGPTLAEWFESDTYRGCAFINAVGELGPILPGVVEISRRHKREMIAEIEQLLPESEGRARNAEAIAIAVDGAIIRAQFDESADAAVEALERVVDSVAGSR